MLSLRRRAHFEKSTFFCASNFGDENGDPEPIPGPVQIQQGSEMSSWASKKQRKRASKNESIFGAVLGAKEHGFWLNF